MQSEYQYNPANQLPTPGCPLVVRLETGEEVDAVRPNYIVSRNAPDKGYVDMKSNSLKGVKEWRYK